MHFFHRNIPLGNTGVKGTIPMELGRIRKLEMLWLGEYLINCFDLLSTEIFDEKIMSLFY